MNGDDVIRMAKETGYNCAQFTSITTLKRFAALVAAAELEKFAQWMLARSYATGHGDTIEDLLEELVAQVADREREACATACAKLADEGYDWLTARRCAESILERADE